MWVGAQTGSEYTFCLSFSHYYFAFCNKSSRRENTLILNNNQIIFLIINNFICERANCVRSAFASHCLALFLAERLGNDQLKYQISERTLCMASFIRCRCPQHYPAPSKDTVSSACFELRFEHRETSKGRIVKVDGNMYRVLMNTFTNESSK